MSLFLTPYQLALYPLEHTFTLATQVQIPSGTFLFFKHLALLRHF
jgi:hypothetical protein